MSGYPSRKYVETAVDGMFWPEDGIWHPRRRRRDAPIMPRTEQLDRPPQKRRSPLPAPRDDFADRSDR